MKNINLHFVNKSVLAAALAAAFIFSSCSKWTELPEDVLTDIGLLGSWEISSRTVNGATDPSVTCCEYLELESDTASNDVYGVWFYEADTVSNSGTFVVDTIESTIWFYSDNSTFSRAYEVASYDVIGLTHFVGSNYFGEIWRRQ